MEELAYAGKSENIKEVIKQRAIQTKMIKFAETRFKDYHLHVANRLLDEGC